MDITQYNNIFQQAADLLNKNKLQKSNIEIATGIMLNSVYLKLYKRSWANPSADPLTVPSRIFFSVWVNDDTLNEQKVFYNIHAFKLRHLQGYSIQSRKFAESFRKKFKPFEKKWPNVSIDFGPLTLMEGWLKMDTVNLQQQIITLAYTFSEQQHLINETLAEFKI